MTQQTKGLSAYRTDTQSVNDGAWVDLKGGIRVKVRYENCLSVQEATRRIDKKYRTILMTEGGLPADIQAQRDAELISSAILVEWMGEGLPTGAGFNPNAVKTLLLEDDLADLRRDIVYACRMSENFRAAEIEKLKGN